MISPDIIEYGRERFLIGMAIGLLVAIIVVLYTMENEIATSIMVDHAADCVLCRSMDRNEVSPDKSGRESDRVGPFVRTR
jgi:hypothetical protein